MPKSAAASSPSEPKPGRKGNPAALSRPMKPSAELAGIVGHHPLPRTDVVAKVWAHIRAHSLQDPDDRRTIVADDKLKAVFGKDRCTMFEMQKLISLHVTAA